MDRIQYVVGEAHGQWFVQVHDQLYGPYQSQALAIKDAIKASRMAARRRHLVRRCVDWCRTAVDTSKFSATLSKRRARNWARAKSLIIASFCVASIATFATSAIRVQARPIPVTVNDGWKPEAANVQNINEAMLLMPAYIRRQRGTTGERITAGIDQFVRDRFIHGHSLLSPSENWFAVVSGYI